MQMLRLAVVALMCVMLEACAPTSAIDAQEPALDDVPTIMSPAQIVLPIHAYLPSVDLSVAMLLVSQDLVNTCIMSGGSQSTIQIGQVSLSGGVAGEFQPATASGLTNMMAAIRDEDRTYSSLWGFFSPDTVAQYGYTRPPGGTTLAAEGGDTEDPVVESCLAQVDLMAPGGNALKPFMISELPDGGPPVPASDSRFVAVEQEWSACMSQRGFDFVTPIDAIQAHYAATTDSEKALAKSVAVADVQCKLDTNLVGVAVAVQSAYEQQYIDTHRAALLTMQAQIADYLAARVSTPSASPTASATPR